MGVLGVSGVLRVPEVLRVFGGGRGEGGSDAGDVPGGILEAPK